MASTVLLARGGGQVSSKNQEPPAFSAGECQNSKDQKLLAFLQHVDTVPGDCWPELVGELRERYPEYKTQLVVPLWKTGDKMLRLNVIRSIDVNRDDERQLLQKLIRQSHWEEDALELQAVRRTGHDELVNAVERKRGRSQRRTQKPGPHN